MLLFTLKALFNVKKDKIIDIICFNDKLNYSNHHIKIITGKIK
jgi:hypothetical protein